LEGITFVAVPVLGVGGVAGVLTGGLLAAVFAVLLLLLEPQPAAASPAAAITTGAKTNLLLITLLSCPGAQAYRAPSPVVCDGNPGK
jgi:hypothetical protein